MTDKRLPAPPARLTPWLLFFASVALYGVCLANGLTNWDDPRYVDANPFAKQGLAGILAAFTSGHDDAYYPVTHAIYCVIQAVAGTSPFAHHLVQVVIFAAGVALVPGALASFGVRRDVGFWAALLWLVHPTRVESVAWVANLKDAVGVAALLAAFALYGAGRRRLSAVALTVSLLGKSMLFPMAGLFVLLELREKKALRAAVISSLPWLVPAVVLAGVGAWLHLGAEFTGSRSVPGGSLPAAIPSVLWLPWWYLGRLLIPFHPQAVYAYQPVGWFDPRLAVALVAWAGVAAFVIRGPRDGRLGRATLALAWALPFAAVTGLVPLVFPVADRYALLPSLAVATALVLLASRLRPQAAAAVLAIATVGLVPGNVLRQREWHDSIALWEADLARAPEVPAVRINLGGAYGEAERWDDAIAQLEELRRIHPELERVTRDLFFATAARDRMQANRILDLSVAIDRAHGDPVQLVAIANAARREKSPAAAALVAEAALRRGPNLDALLLLAQIALQQNQAESALQHAELALAIDPANALGRVAKAMALVKLGKAQEALQATEERVGDPKQQALLVTARASALISLGRVEEARDILLRVQSDLPIDQWAAQR